jgi:hypothetical protein
MNDLEFTVTPGSQLINLVQAVADRGLTCRMRAVPQEGVWHVTVENSGQDPETLATELRNAYNGHTIYYPKLPSTARHKGR